MDKRIGNKTSGRPKKEKAIPVLVYIEPSHIQAIGGIEIAREVAKEAILNTPKKKDQKLLAP